MHSDSTRIFLVEDDEDDYIMTRDMLAEIEGVRYDLSWEKTYDAALETILKNEHDVYLLDYRLGERTGLELLRESIDRGCTAPLILMTGQGDKDIDLEAMKAGASDYLIKGQIDANLLERSIRYAIEQKKSEKKIRFMAYYDSLTNLPNRSLFQDRLKQAIRHANRHSKPVAIMFLDLDNFKRINDTLGHSMGDLLLQQVAERLVCCIRNSDTVARTILGQQQDTLARLGGDEFTILLTEIAHPEDAAKVAQRILSSLSQPFMLNGQEIFASTSIGITVYPFDGADIESLMKNADAAMYHAKSQGRNNFQYYSLSLNASASERLVLENKLRRALERNEFVLYYQPKINVLSGKMFGMEALVRWNHPEMGMVSPADFIPLAEETGMINPIGEWILRAACRQNKAWQTSGFGPIPVAVNLSSQQFKHQNLIEQVSMALEDSGLAPRFLELEITESVIMENTEMTITTLKELRGMGVKLSLDDFGMGYSSLSNLINFPLDFIKIDRFFCKDISRNAGNKAIVEAIIAMARSMGLSVIAEGVESEEQLIFLYERGCHLIQGFLFSRPVPREEMLTLLSDEKESRGIGLSHCRRLTGHTKADI